jgi:hypothetical protein
MADILYEDLHTYREELRTGQGGRRRKRFIQRSRDRFGRVYIVSMDSLVVPPAPTGLIERVYTLPPGVPDVPDQYLYLAPDRLWRMEPRFVDYVRVLKRSELEWKILLKQQRDKLAREEPESKAYEVVGLPPQDWRFIALAARGDLYCLGYQHEPTPAARIVVEERAALVRLVPRFVAQNDADELRLPGELEDLMPRERRTVPLMQDELDEQEAREFARRAALREEDTTLTGDDLEDEDEDLSVEEPDTPAARRVDEQLAEDELAELDQLDADDDVLRGALAEPPVTVANTPIPPQPPRRGRRA